MKLDELVAFLKKIIPSSDNTEQPKIATYTPPDYQCSDWILLLGPAYQDKGMTGSLLVTAKAVNEWASGHVLKSWNSNSQKQQALEYLVSWTAEENIVLGYVTILDTTQREVLQVYSGNLIKIHPCQIWCPECKKIYPQIIDATEYLGKKGSESKKFLPKTYIYL